MISRATALRLTAAIVAILALAVVASVLPNVIDPAGDNGISDGGSNPANASESGQTPVEPGNELYLQLIIAALIFLFVVAILWMLLYDRQELLVLLKRMAAVVIIVAIFLAVAMAVMEPPEPGPPENITGAPGGSGPGEAGSDPGDSGEANADSNLMTVNDVLLVAGILLALAAAGYVLRRYWNRGDGEAGETLPDDSAAAEVAAVAGSTADRIQAADETAVENEVYRAWKRMTESLPVENPTTSTPGEFADAAIDAGFDPADVRELTSLFEAVRYGPRDAADVDTDRAVSIMRRIESATESGSAADERAELASGESE